MNKFLILQTGTICIKEIISSRKNDTIISQALTMLLMLSLLFTFPIEPAHAMEMEMNHSNGHAGSHEQMEHPTAAGHFTYQQVAEGVRGEFEVMNLASMNMKDPAGNTHHIMVKFFREDTNEQIKDIAGKIKVLAPAGEEQISSLKDYSGIYAANFTFAESGKYGVICLFKADGKKGVIKFWYNHPGS